VVSHQPPLPNLLPYFRELILHPKINLELQD
jgi:hypothetical protein